ncbi:hypothetical protein [Streptosporangium roseum]|uniref:hypothetical protein n=1 Tax=Streptosporangium roseum TaxID=2001 RepID=UPI0004CCA761|nr:hypothetical protein [Streptosporangium roseum]
MINHLKPIDETPACECGAVLEQGRFRCRECRARDRWVRRQAAKRRTTARSGQSQPPAHRPRGIVEAGVSWT